MFLNHIKSLIEAYEILLVIVLLIEGCPVIIVNEANLTRLLFIFILCYLYFVEETTVWFADDFCCVHLPSSMCCDVWLKKSGELVYQIVNSLICLWIHVILEGVNFYVLVSGLWSWNGSCAHQTSNEAAASAEYICPTPCFSFLANAGREERIIGAENWVLLGCVSVNYRGAFQPKVTVSLYWSNSEQNPAPNLCIDLDREFQKLSEQWRSIITIWNQWPLCAWVSLK